MSDGKDLIRTDDLAGEIARLENEGLRLDMIFPADAPRVAELSNGTKRVRVDAGDQPPTPPVVDGATYTSGGAWGEGRASMLYRDLIPDRCGGAVIASHIRITEPGPVPDYVHHHAIRFQVIFCRRGRVQVVYEDQGQPFWMEAGDCVLQPPHIRHRVLASDGVCEVVEIASPAEHPTFIDHQIELPTPTINTSRDFGGQKFSFDRGSDLEWKPLDDGWMKQTTGIHKATDGIGSVRMLRPLTGDATLRGAHDGELLLFYVLDDGATLTCGDATFDLGTDDSITIPAHVEWELRAGSKEFRVLVVELTADLG